MKRFDPRIVFGFLLLTGGVLALMQTMGYLKNASDVFWGSILIMAGLAFLSLVVAGQWWGVFPGFPLLSAGVSTLFPKWFDAYGGAIFLGGIALAFWIAYATARQERWWALIPAGVLTTLASMTIAAERFGGFESGGFFFLGLALTFLLVALLAGMRWAYWPALALAIIGVLALVSVFDVANYIGAIALMVAGGYLLFRYFSNR